MPTLHIENKVHDFDSWKAVFDKFGRFREDQRVRGYRLSRVVGAPDRVVIDLDFDTADDATAFRSSLQKIWSSPQSGAQLVEHGEPRLLEVVERA